MNIWPLVAAFLASAISAWLTRRFCDPLSRLHLLDHPNERSLHSRPTPRTGGVAILAGVFSVIPIWAYNSGGLGPGLWLILGGLIVAAFSFFDDRHGLPASVRLLSHFLGASFVVIGAGLTLPSIFHQMSIFSSWVGIGLTIVFLVWMVNLYNFMDGMDGFAGGMTVIGFATLGVFGWLAGNVPFLMVSLSVAAAAAGFLFFNFPPARIFMGDTGSASLGLLAGGLILWGSRDAVLPFWAGVLVFSPFIVDATVTLLTRVMKRERFWLAHRTHFYQRLVMLGWGHRKTVLAEYILMIACSGSALWMAAKPQFWQTKMLLFWALVYTLLAILVSRLERQRS